MRADKEGCVNGMKLWREKLPGGDFHIHADGAFSDGRTLCGYAFEGACTKTDEDYGVKEVSRGKINCRSCLSIIYQCKAIPARRLDR